jgi:energy-coupling factor transporter ATP-binding protein EcfA2
MRFDARDIAHSYPSRFSPRPEALRGVTVSIQPGECVGIIGPEGAGKSTLLQVLAGLLKPDTGTLRIDNTEAWQPEAPGKDIRRRIGFAFQFPEEQFFCESVSDELLYAHRTLGLPGKADAAGALRMVGLNADDLLKRSPYSLSMGEARRVALACLLVLKPDALLLDEPTVGLDGAGVDLIQDLLLRLTKEGTTLLVVSHDLDMLAEVVTRIIILDNGKVEADGPVDEILTDELLLERHGYHLPEIVSLLKAGEGIDLDRKFCTVREARALMASGRRS